MSNDDRIIELVKTTATLDSDIKTLYKSNSATNRAMEKNHTQIMKEISTLKTELMGEISAIRADQKVDKADRDRFGDIITRGKTAGITFIIIIFLMANGAVSALQLIFKKFI